MDQSGHCDFLDERATHPPQDVQVDQSGDFDLDGGGDGDGGDGDGGDGGDDGDDEYDDDERVAHPSHYIPVWCASECPD